jgi:hypothetical protein
MIRGEKVDKNVPFYMGFYKYRDSGSTPLSSDKGHQKMAKTLNSLDFASTRISQRAIQTVSNSRQTPMTSSCEFPRSSKPADRIDVSARSRLEQSSHFNPRSSLLDEANPFASGNAAQIQNLKSQFFKKADLPEDSYFFGLSLPPKTTPKLESRLFMYPSKEPAFRSEVVNSKNSSMIKEQIHPLLLNNQRYDRKPNFELQATETKMSMNYNRSRSKKETSVASSIDGDLLSFSRLIRSSAKKQALSNQVSSIEEMTKIKTRDVYAITSIDFNRSTAKKRRLPFQQKNGLTMIQCNQQSKARMAPGFTKLSLAFANIFTKKAFMNIRRHASLTHFLLKIEHNFELAARRKARMGMRGIKLQARFFRYIAKGLVKVRQLVKKKKAGLFRLLKTSCGLRILQGIAQTKRNSAAGDLLQYVKIFYVKKLLPISQKVLLSRRYSNLKSLCLPTNRKKADLRTFSSFLLQISLICDNGKRHYKYFFQKLKRQAFLLQVIKIHVEKKEKIIQSQKTLALKRLRIFARYRKLALKHFKPKRLS